MQLSEIHTDPAVEGCYWVSAREALDIVVTVFEKHSLSFACSDRDRDYLKYRSRYLLRQLRTALKHAGLLMDAELGGSYPPAGYEVNSTTVGETDDPNG